ncbi:hypothetical protein [Thermococcus sp.]|uniref:hypothetical protein n=1 Tax=Thermococcus sp. TaxID=35749 RepID=UPI0025EFBB89|nr:hypothetical protein [Thermococcus sp.]
MNKKKKTTIPILVLLVITMLYFSPKGVLMSTDAKGVAFENKTMVFPSCPPYVQVKTEHYQRERQHFINFTISVNSTLKTNWSLEGSAWGYFCTERGIFLYTYYPEEGGEDGDAVFFDYRLNAVWERGIPEIPYMKTDEGLVLKASARKELVLTSYARKWEGMGSSCVHILDLSTGTLTNWLCPGVFGAYISDARVVENRIFLTLISSREPPLETYAALYGQRDGEVVRREIAYVEGELSDFELLLDANRNYVVVVYSLVNEKGNEKNGICVFTAGRLMKITCKEFKKGDRPLRVELKGNIVYVKTTKGVKAYKILSLW